MTTETWLDPAEGLSKPNTTKADLPPHNMPPLDGGEWLSKIVKKSRAELKAEEHRTGKPTPLPKVW